MVMQLTIKIKIWFWKAEIGLIWMWNNKNLPQGTNIIGMKYGITQFWPINFLI
jgi:hypothetical protein